MQNHGKWQKITTHTENRDIHGDHDFIPAVLIGYADMVHSLDR